MLFVFYLGIMTGNYMITGNAIYGGVLYKSGINEGYIVYKYKSIIIPYLEHTMTVRIDDYLIIE